jgi:phosphoglycerate-specific signal transduction histidine kinase
MALLLNIICLISSYQWMTDDTNVQQSLNINCCPRIPELFPGKKYARFARNATMEQTIQTGA